MTQTNFVDEARYALTRRLSPLLATQARRRMAVVAASTLLFALFSAAVETIFPLWVTKDLGLTADQWALLRSLRFAGVCVGVILLGALSDRFGQRLFGALSLFGAAAAIVAIGSGKPLFLWVFFPIYGALISTVFVNLNTLTQQISHQRQGLANSIYRGIGTGVGIVAPVIATQLAHHLHGYATVFTALAGLLVAAGVILLWYPGEAVPPSLGDARAELRRLLDGYRTALRQQPLMRFIHLSMLWGNVMAGVGTFIAIRYTLELDQSDAAYGFLVAVAGVAAFAGTLGIGFVLDRLSLRKLHAVVGVLTGVCSVIMGLNDSVALTAVGFILFSLFANLLLGPSSMWVGRAAGEGTLTAAFSVHKVLAAFYVAVTMFLLGVLEQFIGIRLIFLFGGLLGIVLAFGFFLLPEPPKPGLPPAGAAPGEPPPTA